MARALETAADGKTVIDVTNALSPDFQLAVGFTTSGAEKLQKVLPRAHVVKAFNTVFAQHMSTGKVNGEQLTAFAAGDNEAARKAVLELAKAIGVSVRNWFRSMPVVLKLPPIGAACSLRKTISAMSAPRTLRLPAAHSWTSVASMLPPRG